MAGCSTYGTFDFGRGVDHDLLCRRPTKQKRTYDEEHHKGHQSPPRLVAVGDGKAKKAAPRSHPPAEITLPSPPLLPPNSYLSSQTLMPRTSVNLSELSVDVRREGTAIANPPKPAGQVLVTS